jgi:hypothetical protein
MERAEEFMKDWVTDGLGIMEVYMRNVVTGETRFVKNDGKGVTTIFSMYVIEFMSKSILSP